MANPNIDPQILAQQITEVVKTHGDVMDAAQRLEEAKQAREMAKELCLQTICPVESGQTIVLSKNKTFTAGNRTLEIRDGEASWRIQGTELMYSVSDSSPKGSLRTLTQDDYDALPAEANELTVQQVKNNHAEARAQHLARKQSGPLKLSDPQQAMLAHLFHKDKWNLDEGRLPNGVIWNSNSGTEVIWKALVDKGVLEKKGDIELNGRFSAHSPYSPFRWVVIPGPRMEEACEIAKIKFDPKDLKRAREAHYDVASKPSAPKPR